MCEQFADSVGHEVIYAEPSRQLLRLLAVSGLGTALPIRASVAQMLDSTVVVVEGSPCGSEQPLLLHDAQ